MTRLRQRDFAAFSQALTALYADASAATLSERILSSVRGLFDCDFASFSLMDLRRGRFHTFAHAPVVVDLPGMDVHQRHLHSDPAARYLMRTRRPDAVKVSDFVGLREYRSLSVYTEVFSRVKCDRRLGFALQDGSAVSLVSTVNRKGRDFSEEDRCLLDLLRPHLLQANALAHADQQVRTAQERELARVGDLFGAGLGEIDAAGRFAWLTPRAEKLLTEFFPRRPHRPSAGRLPGELEQHLAPTLQQGLMKALQQPGKPPQLVWRFAGPVGRKLKVQLIASARPTRWQILLEETNVDAPTRLLTHTLKLTPREAEVLSWLKQGKTNWEIGTILGVTEKTAGKHLENIFAKLGVENRAAAVRVATEASRAS